MTIHSNDQHLWAELCAAENAFYKARMALFREVSDWFGVLAAALENPSQRGTALRVLEILPEHRIREQTAALIRLASVGHSDIALCRAVILKIDWGWLVENVDPIVRQVLAGGGAEEYRRTAELYALLDSDLLKVHLERCRASNDADIREIADDFASPSRTGTQCRYLALHTGQSRDNAAVGAMGEEYDSNQITKLPWPQWEQTADLRWRREVVFEFEESIGARRLSLIREFVYPGTTIDAQVGDSPTTIVVLQYTALNPNLDNIFYESVYGLMKYTASVAPLRSILGVPVTSWAPFRGGRS